jgi:hypothetical protein
VKVSLCLVLTSSLVNLAGRLLWHNKALPPPPISRRSPSNLGLTRAANGNSRSLGRLRRGASVPGSFCDSRPSSEGLEIVSARRARVVFEREG